MKIGKEQIYKVALLIEKVIKFTNNKKIKSIGFTGFNGGYLKKYCTISIHSKFSNYGISKDINHILMHLSMRFIKINNLNKNIKKPIL